MAAHSVCKRRAEAEGSSTKKQAEEKDICETSLRPDLVMWSADQKSVVIVELTIPWEENIQSAHERKKLKYEELAQQCRQNGWRTNLYPVEVGVRGFAGTSLMRLCRDFQIRGKPSPSLFDQWQKKWRRAVSPSGLEGRPDVGRAETTVLEAGRRRPPADQRRIRYKGRNTRDSRDLTEDPAQS
ncbi:hypothetical protein Bbelb_291250 [Branchiostoma belcheri]|nr:hypothetical protein Bbelb_291250 [Branchiostoma belcheri]